MAASHRSLTIGLLALPTLALLAGTIALVAGQPALAGTLWTAGTVPVLAVLVVTMAMSVARGEFGLDLIAALAMAGSIALGEHLAGVVIALMFAGGQALEAYAERRARREISALLSRAPRLAQRVDNGTVTTVPVDEIRPQDRIMVRAGELVPVDGLIADAEVTVDESALTGESVPVVRGRGALVLSGSANAGSPFIVVAVRPAADSAYAGIIRLVEAAQHSKAPMARLADRWALLFLVLTAALATLAFVVSGDPVRALAVLVVATPCPLILAVPAAMVSGMSRAARRGVLIKSAAALEALAKANILLVDKTGTLTEGRARLTSIVTATGVNAQELLRLAGSLAQASHHVLSESIAESARERGLVLTTATAIEEKPGAGLSGTVDGRDIALGSRSFIASQNTLDDETGRRIARAARDDAAMTLVAIDGAAVGALILADEIRPDAARAIRALRAAGIGRVELVTGDRADIATSVGIALGVDEVHAGVSPEGKVSVVADARRRGTTIMVGDGINDAPALAAADVGIAMGARGAAASAQAADIVCLVDRIDRLAEALAIAKRTRAIAAGSALIGMVLSLAAMLVAAAGHLPPVAGALVQEAIDAAVVLNALRALSGAKRKQRDTEGLDAREAASLRREHRELAPLVDTIRSVADRLQELPPPAARDELTSLEAALRERIVPHEQHDDAALYPRMGRLIGGNDPMAAMSRGHREIFALAQSFARQVADLPKQGPDAASAHELQRLLYGLEAVLRLHFAQEDEIYHALADG
jgi:heavy metal translocating P-type ATPase